VDFELSSHEVMRGVKVRDGKLVLRPFGGTLAGNAVDALFGAALAVWALVAGGLWVVFAPVWIYSVVESVAKLRLAAVADDRTLVIRNRWRTHRIEIADVGNVFVDDVEWWFRAPTYTGTRPHLFGPRAWLIGVVQVGGRRYECETLVSTPNREDVESDPTPAEMKTATLARWIDTVRAAQPA
jgi:hypothetical protein